MDVRAVSPALAGRLGVEATAGLVELIDSTEQHCMEAVLNRSVERFERRLVEETSALRVQMARLGAELRQEITTLRSDARQESASVRSGLRQEMTTLRSDLRQEMATLRSDLRQEMAMLGSDLRQEMAMLGSDVRQEMASLGSDLRRELAGQRVDILKWSFVFWIGQVVAVAGIMTMILRATRF